MIKIEHLTKKYGEGDSCCLALNDVSADIQENTFTVITGKSGSGKTTLLNMIGLIDKPDSGRHCFSGIRILQKRQREICSTKE